MPKTVTELGNLVAQGLAGAWRPEPPPLALLARELAEITPQLLEMGRGVSAGGGPALPH